jgi:hypothetical protein
MNELETKNIVVKRIISHLNPVPVGAANELLQQPLADLGVILEKLISTRDQENAEEEALARIHEAKTQRAFDGAWGATLARVSLNGRYLCDVESNRSILESLLNPGELPTPAGYSTLVLQFPTKFSWQTPQSKPTTENQRKAFDAFVRENSLSSVDANFNLFQEGASVEHFAGASGIERAQYASEAAQARQKFLINSATPTQLRDEARFQSATEREIFLKAEADRQHQVSLSQQQQSGMFPPLPATHAETGETIDASWLRKTSTINFELFKKLCKRHGSAAVTSRLRGEN